VELLGSLRRLAIPNTTRPTTTPTTMDSHGNPGIPGSATGVMADDEDEAVTV
jgi:hypothetical protein